MTEKHLLHRSKAVTEAPPPCCLHPPSASIEALKAVNSFHCCSLRGSSNDETFSPLVCCFSKEALQTFSLLLLWETWLSPRLNRLESFSYSWSFSWSLLSTKGCRLVLMFVDLPFLVKKKIVFIATSYCEDSKCGSPVFLSVFMTASEWNHFGVNWN